MTATQLPRDCADVLEAIERIVLDELAGCAYSAANDLRNIGGAIAEVYAQRDALLKALEHARYVGLHIGRDCALALADLQESGVYKPRCSDGKPSNANARRDVSKIEESTAQVRAAFDRCKGTQP